MVGRPDNVFGEIVVAVVVWKANSSKNVLELELSEFLKSRLAAYKRPKQIHMVSKIPRNMMGKVNKKSLLSDLGLE